MLVDRLGLEGKIIFTRFTNDQDLPAIYQMADVFIAPSLFEGFGFTPLESMAAGTPVAAASCTSLPEVVGDAALLFDPLEVEDMADKMLALLTDETLKESLVERGYRNVRRFRWSNCCRQTAVEFDKILQQL